MKSGDSDRKKCQIVRDKGDLLLLDVKRSVFGR